MSTLKVVVTPVLDINAHPNADRLEIASVLGWTCVVPKDVYQPGQSVVYIPVDAVLPVDLSDRIGVTRYLSNGRVRAAKLRGAVSYGLIMANEGDHPVGTDLTEALGITKFEPPIRVTSGDILPPHPALTHYTNIENIKNYPTLFEEGEEVIATEKVHGTNCIHALFIDEDGQEVFMASSHRHRRKQDPESTYWRTFDEATRALLREAIGNGRTALIYKEVYGSKIQHLNYGLSNAVQDVAFDLCVDGRYVDYDRFKALCDTHRVSTAPLLYRGAFDRARLGELINGKGVKTVVGQGQHIMEGAVIKPTTERWNPLTGRTILKWISDAYALDKNATDFH